MLQMGDTVGPRYTAPKISAISYLFGTFSLLIMGDTERPRYTGFRGLSVRGITVLQCNIIVTTSMKGWSGGAMVLGKLPVPGRRTTLITVGQGPTAFVVGAGGGCLDIFTLIYPFFPLSPSFSFSLEGPI